MSVLFIGQAPPEKEYDKPFGGTYLYKWLSQVGIAGELLNDCHFCALIDHFPGKAKSGGHLAPTTQQIMEYRPKLIEHIQKVNPDAVVAVGKLSIYNLFAFSDPDFSPNFQLEDLIGNSFSLNPYGALDREIPTIPLPHPSGASTWPHRPGNKQRIQTALELIHRQLMPVVA